MRKFLFILFIVASHVTMAQKFSVKGQLMDSTKGTLPSATIMLLNASDSSLVNFASTDLDGFFQIKNIARGSYFVKATFIGFENYIKAISPAADQTEIDLGEIHMQPQTKLLGTVTVTAAKAPVTVKKDTIEFNAGSFKTKTNATAEDLIKKLPGVEVDNDGTIRAQGEQVQRVMVDGKEFFGQDPKLATRNLPADAVDKVQVYDKKSDQTVFSGIDDGTREKTINLQLKEEKRHASFGNDMVGAGTNNRLTGKASVNRFDKGNQLSFLGMGNNTNEQGFSIGDFANFSGTGNGGGGGAGQTGASINTGRQNGIVKNFAGGLNTNRSYDDNKTKVNASYFYNRLDQNLITDTHRINYLDSGNYNFDQHTVSHNVQDNHRANLTIDSKLDSVNSIKFMGNIAYNLSNQNQFTRDSTFNIGNTSLKNKVDPQTNTNSGNNLTLTSSLLLRHRFKKKGRTISSNLSFAYADNKSDGTLQSTTYFFKPDSIHMINQINSQTTTSPTYGITTSFTEPLGGQQYLELNYNLATDINKTNRTVYDVIEKAMNESLSTRYNSNYFYSRPGVNYRINRDKYNLSVGTSWQSTRLKGFIATKDQHISRLYQAVQPSLHFNYNFTDTKRVRVDYTSSMQEPTIAQLQPVVNNTDPLNLTTGNANLQPAYSHSVRSNFTIFNPNNFMNFFALINANYTANSIVNSQTTTPSFIRITKPVNVKYGASISGNFNVGIPVKAINSRFNAGPTYSTSRGINLTNDKENYWNSVSVGSTARYNYTLGDKVIIDLSANLSHQQTKYSFNAQQNQSFLNQTYTAELNTTFLKNYSYNTEMDYFVYSSQTTDYHQSIPLWNMSVSRYILKNKAGELKIGVNNLLDKSLSVTQTTSTTYLQQSRTNNLGRYFMITFTYALNKQLNPTNGMRMRPGGPGGPGGVRTFRRD